MSAGDRAPGGSDAPEAAASNRASAAPRPEADLKALTADRVG